MTIGAFIAPPGESPAGGVRLLRAPMVLAVVLVIAAVPTLAANAGDAAAPPPPPASPPARFAVGLFGGEDAPASTSGDVAVFHGARVVSAVPAIRLVVVESTDPAAFEADARADPAVRYVERIVPLPLLLFTPNDPQYGQQYGMTQVRANLAWDTTLGDADASVCIVDTGVLYTHQDFQTTRWKGGYDFVNDDADPIDDEGHGTHVAGIAAATTNNGVVTAGMAQVDVYAAKVLDDWGSGTWDDVAAGIVWCADHAGARTVINLSLGCSGGPGACASSAVDDAIAYATDAGHLVVVAAGNEGGSWGCQHCVTYPATHDDAIAVSCSAQGEAFCEFSSSGPQVDVAAPGNEIRSTGHHSSSDYEDMSGTSMSAPHVTGALALYWSLYPATTNLDLRARLLDSGEEHGEVGHDDEWGCGELDVKRLLAGPIVACDYSDPPCDDVPANDCAAAATVHDPVDRIYQSTAGAVLEPGEPQPCGNIGRTVWFRFRATADGTAEATTRWSFFDTVVAAYADAGGAPGALLGCTDDDPGSDDGTVTFTCEKGKWYWVQIGGKDGRAGGMEYNHKGCREVTVPSPPTGVAATAGPNAGQIRLAWGLPASYGNTTLLGFRVYASSSPTGPWSVHEKDFGTRTHEETGLGNGWTRHYKVVAVNAVGESAPVALSARTYVPPGPPRNAYAEPSFPTFSVDVYWDRPLDDGGTLTRYAVYRSSNGPTGNYAWRANVAAGTEEYHDSGLSPLTAYWYKVLAENPAGAGPFSNAACSMPLPYPGVLDACD